MDKCVVPEMRDLLPDWAAERLSGAVLARVAAHVAACPECTAEMEMLAAARRAFSRGVPEMDVSRIVAALPKPPSESATARAARKPTRKIAAVRASTQRPASVGYRRTTWTTWRIAALATVAVGGLSLAVLRSPFHGPAAAGEGGHPLAPASVPTTVPAVVPTQAAPVSPLAGVNPPSRPSPAPTPSVANGASQPAPAPDASEATEGLAVAGDISELSDGDVEALLKGMDGVEAEPTDEPEETAPAIAAVAP